MTKYIVRENVTLIRYVEAENEQDAIDSAKTRGVGDFDEVDSGPGALNHMWAEVDSDAR